MIYCLYALSSDTYCFVFVCLFLFNVFVLLIVLFICDYTIYFCLEGSPREQNGTSQGVILNKAFQSTGLKAAVGNFVVNINNFFVFYLEKMS